MVRGFIMTAEVVNFFFVPFYLSLSFECVITKHPHLYLPARKYNLLPLSLAARVPTQHTRGISTQKSQ